MQARRVTVTILVACLLIFQDSTQRSLAATSVTDNIKQQLEGGVILIDYQSSDQTHPAIAYSSQHHQYLVVDESDSLNGDIYGRFIDASTLTALGTWFIIVNSTHSETSPSVAYDAYNDRFVVVWDFQADDFSSNAIQGKVLYGEYQTSGDQWPAGAGTATLVTGSSYLADPAIAYNEHDHQIMLVYRSAQADISGRMLKVNTSKTNLELLDAIAFSVDTITTGETLTPDVAWGSAGQTFLAVWSESVPGLGPYIKCRYFYDTYQPTGQAIDLLDYIVSAGTGTGVNYHINPEVAYDDFHEFFGIVYQSDDDTSPAYRYQITGVFVKNYATSSPVVIANSRIPIQPLVGGLSNDSYLTPDISYAGLGGAMQVVYVGYSMPLFSEYYDILLRGFYYDGTESKTTSILMVNPGSAGDGREYSIIANSGGGHSLVAWRDEDTDTNWDIRGQGIASTADVMLPLIMR